MKKWILLFVLLSMGLAHAQEQSPSMETCKDQIQLYCKDVDPNDFRETLKCLRKNNDQLSTECKQELQRFVQATRQTVPPGGGPLGALGGLTGPGAQIPSLIYDGRYVPHDGKSPSLLENNLIVSVPFYKTEHNTFAATLNGGDLHLENPLTFTNGKSVPNDFYRTEGGLQYSHSFSERRSLGFRASFGYTGDEISHHTEVYNVSANYSFPQSERSTWVLMVFMSNNSSLGTFIPIPGILYIYTTPTFTGLFGFPVMSMQWTPVNPWSFSLSAFGPQLKTEIAYGPIDKTQFFTGFSWKQMKYIQSKRTTDDERLTFEEKNGEIGFRQPILKGLFSEFQTGYCFNRKIYAGEGLFDKDAGSTTLAPNWYLRWSLKIAF